VIFSQVMPSTEANSQICALLGDYRMGSAMGDRRSLTLALSTEYKFAEDQLAIRGTDRFDINVHDVGSTTVAGPIVGLITAAS
jgi:HK97 family phage major capsid protein